MEITCKNCNITKNENDFRYVDKGHTIYFNIDKCKLCFSKSGKTFTKKKIDLTNKLVRFFGGEVELRKDLDRDIYLLVKRIELNNGNVDEIDCFRLAGLYTELYGEFMTKLSKEYELIYYYEKLRQYVMKQKQQKNNI